MPLLYGLPEVHKADVPLRPIVSFVCSPTYELSKFLAGLLTPLVGLTSSHVRNSRAFVEFMRSQTVQVKVSGICRELGDIADCK